MNNSYQLKKIIFKRLTILILSIYGTNGYAQNSRIIDIGSLGVLIHAGAGSGSGFYVSDTTNGSIFLVTASHVLFDPQQRVPFADTITIVSYKQNSQVDTRDSFKISILSAVNSGSLKYDVVKDVAVVKIATVKNNLIIYQSSVRKLTKTNTYLNCVLLQDAKKIAQLSTLTNVYTVGFPKSLTLNKNFDYSRPLVRKGIISGIDINTNKIITDCPVYQGNSGGPVLEIDDFTGKNTLIGLVSEFIPFEERWINSAYGFANLNVTNSGFSVVVPVDWIIQEMNSIIN